MAHSPTATPCAPAAATLASEEVVRLAYHLLLNRDPEAAGLRHWSSAIDNGLSRIEFVRAVLASPEFRQQMTVADVSGFRDVDLIIPLGQQKLQVPASDISLVPHLLKDRCWEPHITRFFDRELRPDHVFLDVGANLGYFTVRYAPKVARVVAFEPAAANRGYCATNIAINRLDNVELHAVGLWHEDTTLHVRTDSSCVGMAAITLADDVSEGSVEEIRAASLDTMVRDRIVDLPALDFIKMDIEGAELSALMGMRETIARHRPCIVMEINRPALAACGATVDGVWDFLTTRGYRISAFEHWQARDPHPLATLDDLKRLCPADTLIDIAAVPVSA